MYSAMEVARYIVDYSRSQMRAVSNLRLQKLLYFVQAEFLVETGMPCFYEEIYAWDFGPVVPEVYQEYKIFSAASIPSTGTVGKYYSIAEADKKIINEMVDHCARFSTSQLVEFTHHQDPWKNAYQSYDKTITKVSMKEYYSEE